MNILAVSGSLNCNSTTYLAVSAVAKAASKAGANIEFFDLRVQMLPIFDPNLKSSVPSVQLWQNMLLNSDGIILGTPEYHGSISGVLKNALDFIEARYLQNKIVALVGTSGGSMGATNALNTLNIICRNLNAWPLSLSLSVPNSYSAFAPTGDFCDNRLHERANLLGNQLVSSLKMLLC